MSVRRVGSWKDAARRALDAVSACLLPDGFTLFAILVQIDGYLYPHEAVFLYWLARDLPRDSSLLEVGSMRGRSTLCLAKGLQKRGSGRVFAVDPHAYGTESDLRENIEHFDLGQYISPIVAPSLQVAGRWHQPLGLVFLDGDHSQAAIHADVMAWTPHLQPGGFLVLHDSTPLSSFPGPRAVASELRTLFPDYDSCGSLGSITWARRAGGTSPAAPRTYGRNAFDSVLYLLVDRRDGVSSGV
jgi:hypothetical protein